MLSHVFACKPFIPAGSSRPRCTQIYDRGSVHIGALDTCLAVPPLLAAFYVTLGTLQILVDQYRSDDGATQAALRRATWPTLALNLGCDQCLE